MRRAIKFHSLYRRQFLIGDIASMPTNCPLVSHVTIQTRILPGMDVNLFDKCGIGRRFHAAVPRL